MYVPGAVEPMLPDELSNGACSLVPGEDRLDRHRRAGRARRGVARRLVLPLVDPLRRAARVRGRSTGSSRASSEPRASGRARSRRRGRRPARSGAGARAARGARARVARSPSSRSIATGNVIGVEPVRADRIAPADRASDDRRERAGGAVARGAARAGAVSRPRAPGGGRRRAARSISSRRSGCRLRRCPGGALTPQQAADIVGEASQLVADWVASHGGRGARALNRLVLRSLKQAYYDDRNLGHAGLQSPRYCHFTSPIRRYPDLICHRALLSAVAGGGPAPDASFVAAAGPWSLGARARGDDDRAGRRRHRALLPARAAAVRAAVGRGGRVRGRGRRPDRRRGVRRVRRRRSVRGDAAGPAVARRLVGAQRAADGAGRDAARRRAAARRPGRGAGRRDRCAARQGRPASPSSRRIDTDGQGRKAQSWLRATSRPTARRRTATTCSSGSSAGSC